MTFIQGLIARLKTPEGLFVALGLFFGLILLFLIPPLQTPDENVHFLRAYQVAQGQLVSSNDDNKSGGYLPRSIQKTFDEVDGAQSISFHPELKYDLHRTKSAMSIPLDQSDQRYYNITAAAAYSPIGYIPQSLAITLGRILNLPPIYHIYIARLAVLLTWIAIFTFAIRCMPYKKWALVGVALLPMMVAQSVSIGVDAVSISTGVLFLSLILRSMTHALRGRTLIAIIVSASVMVLSKQIAVIFLPLIFLVAGTQFKTKVSATQAKILVTLIPFILLVCWTIIVGNPGQSLNQIANNQSTSGQIMHLIDKPTHFAVVLFNTFFFSWGDSIVDSLIGVFGWMDTPLSGPFVAIGYMTLAAVFLLNYKEKAVYMSRTKKRIIIVIATIYVLALCGALYVTYSPVAFNIIYGLQGRYLLPVLFLLVPVFAAKDAIVTKRRYIFSTILPMSLLLATSVIAIWLRYYIEYKY